jgi:hypothetical protein
LMKQLASISSLQMTSCSKPDFLNFLQVVLSGLLHANWHFQTWCNLFHQLAKVCKCQLAACLISIGLLQVDAVNKPAETCWQLAAGR